MAQTKDFHESTEIRTTHGLPVSDRFDPKLSFSINENNSSQMFSRSFVCDTSKNSTYENQQECAHISLSTTTCKNTNPQLTRSVLSDNSMRTYYFTTHACLKHCNCWKVKVPSAAHKTQSRYSLPWQGCPCTVLSCHHLAVEDQVICESTAWRISHSRKNCKFKRRILPGSKLQPFNC